LFLVVVVRFLTLSGTASKVPIIHSDPEKYSFGTNSWDSDVIQQLDNSSNSMGSFCK